MHFKQKEGKLKGSKKLNCARCYTKCYHKLRTQIHASHTHVYDIVHFLSTNVHSISTISFVLRRSTVDTFNALKKTMRMLRELRSIGHPMKHGSDVFNVNHFRDIFFLYEGPLIRDVGGGYPGVAKTRQTVWEVVLSGGL